MKESTPEEIRKRYRELSDDQLLVLAVDSSQLTAASAAALRLELKSRKLGQTEVAETRTTLEQWRAKEPRYDATSFDPWRDLIGTWSSLLHSLLLCCLWLLLQYAARWLFHSNQSAKNFEIVVFSLCIVTYLGWRLVSWVKTVRRRRKV